MIKKIINYIKWEYKKKIWNYINLMNFKCDIINYLIKNQNNYKFIIYIIFKIIN